MKIKIISLILLTIILTSYKMDREYFFPFGAKLKPVVQTDTTPKKVFVLGVYASAVHAKWIDNNGNVKVKALAVASEPYIFWRGDSIEAKNIISEIKIPIELGKLIPADSTFNGPSGIALDNSFLEPLGYTRNEAWLCDLLPQTCINSSQKFALDREYEPLRLKYNLPQVTIPQPPKIFSDEKRVIEILEEIKKSEAEKIILLGDMPIKFFLSKVTNGKYKKLSDFGQTVEEYGKEHLIYIGGKEYKVIPLVHPRQADALGKSSENWNWLHRNWINNKKI
ncbi:MAG: hypothetical protein H0X63_10020 [Flavobacteriales bacterium]|nr:hypothetical protein [Flavobacteriales bacterium]